MAEEPVQPQAPATAVTADMLRAAVDLVRGIGFILTNTTFYGPRHNVTVQSIYAAAGLAESFHRNHGALHLDLSGGDFQIAATPLGDRAANTEALRTRMLALGARELVLEPGVTAEELAHFATLLFTPEAAATVAGGFAGLVRQAGFDHIRSAAYVYRRVADDEEVVKKGESAGGLARQMAGRIGKFLAGEAGEAGAEYLNDNFAKDTTKSYAGDFYDWLFGPPRGPPGLPPPLPPGSGGGAGGKYRPKPAPKLNSF